MVALSMTPHLGRVYDLANQEAHRFYHDFISTALLFLGLAKQGFGTGARIISARGIDLSEARKDVESRLKKGPAFAVSPYTPLSPVVTRVNECATYEAGQLGHDFVGTGHLVLGLLHRTEGIAGQLLLERGCELKVMRQAVRKAYTKRP